MEAREVAGRGVAPVPDAWRNDKQVLILRKYFINLVIARLARPRMLCSAWCKKYRMALLHDGSCHPGAP